MLLEHQICILGFLKDHVTLRIGAMALENSALPLQEYSKLHFFIYIETEFFYFTEYLITILTGMLIK